MDVDLMADGAQIGEDALLEALNSTPIVDGAATDRWADDAVLAGWSRQHGGSGAPDELDRLRVVRADLQAVVSGSRPADVLDRHLAGVTASPAVADGAVTWRLDTTSPVVRLVLAWSDAAHRWPGRLRPCANDECRLYLLDRSRPGNARWCSMRTCGNRLKARRHHERTH
ncbi:CGNR zinc finger domain-containing protein [Actinomycetospora sp. OC33-EN08]|uniref:CGNR zinc finger domain-containing protein n=1 Tax=Actinomycetospora aurantiaca TaxID=3129233 RepID=A0ABU8MKD7_9PSEU